LYKAFIEEAARLYGAGENDLPFLGVEVTQLHSEVQYASWAC